MVKAIIDIDESTNRLLNIIKAQFGLRDKSAAIEVLAEEYEELVSSHNLKPAYLKRLKQVQKERTVRVGSVEGLRKRYSKR
ncbi:MAG: DUF2683 family protein [Candidatus Micrarchaeota archaeon]|nr:DUF2683 family protein [Candidatus Micrarchaeota archaeon]